MQDTQIQGFRLSPQQRRLWLLQRSSGEEQYTSTCTVRISGRLDVPLLRAAIDDAAAPFEILRTTYQGLEEMTLPVQMVGDRPLLAVQVHDLAGLGTDEQRAMQAERQNETKRQRFDFANGPLGYVELFAFGPEDHLLDIRLSALCCDAKGLANLVGEIGRCYRSGGQGTSADDTPLQYVDASNWLNDVLDSDETAGGREFWQAQDFAELVTRTLPFEGTAASSARFEPRRVAVPLDVDRLRTPPSRADVSLDIFLLACWQTVLQRITGKSQILVGYGFDGRSYEELDRAVGLFARALPLAGPLPEDLTFAELASRLDREVREATKRAECFDWTVLSPAGTSQASPPHVPFVLEYVEQPSSVEAGGVVFEFTRCDTSTDRHKIRLVAQLSAGGASASLEYDAALYADEDVTRLAGQLAAIAIDAAARPSSKIGTLRMITDEEQAIVQAANDTRREFPAVRCVHHLVEAQAMRVPDAPAVIAEDQRLTYGELNVSANQLARRLKSLGVGPDVLVGICLERSAEVIPALLGVLKAGGAYVPLDPRLPPARLADLFQESGARALITRQSLSHVRPPTDAALLLDADASEIAAESGENLPDRVAPENLAYVLFTSGSTGRPKGVAIEHRQLVNYIHAVTDRFGLPEGESYATVTTFAADLGNTAIYPALSSGGCLHVISENRATDAEALGDYFDRHRIGVLKIVPSHLKALLSGSRPARILPQRCLVLGGEPCTWELVDEVRRLAPDCAVFNHYGPTETTVGATTYRIPDGAARPLTATVPIGRPLANVAAYVMDAELRPTPIWSAGELYIGGAAVGRGYLNAPETTAQKFIPDPFAPAGRLYRTGDHVRRLPSGDLEFLGRIDDQVKIRGFRVELGEVSAALRRHAAVSDAAVIVRENGTGEKRLFGYVVCREGSRPSGSDFKTFLKEHLPDYMVPSAVGMLKTIPLTSNGKVDRAALPDLTGVHSSGQLDEGEPLTAWETSIAAIWREFLQIDDVDVHDNFYDVGGHSLLAVQVVTALERRTGLHVSPRDLVFHTLKQFAALCEGRAQDTPA